jgi:hypothetical protein
MAHQLVLFINLFGLFLFDAFFMADVNISQNVPATMAAGSEVRVTVNVTKGNLGGFAKLQLDLPPGLTATAIETKGASFTFADQKAKFIWMQLPSTPTFRVSYTLKADAGAVGPHTITGRLSYIEDNERRTYDLPAVTVRVEGAEVAQTPAVPTSEPDLVQVIDEEEEVELGDLVSAAGGVPVGSTPVAVIENAGGIPSIQGQGGVRGTRTIKPVSEKEMIVEVKVRKGDIRGFGKLQETIPQGFTAVEQKSDEAIFTATDRIVKFVWLNLPNRDEITVVYKLRADLRPDGEYSIDGEFGYLLNDETQKAVIGTSKFFVGPKALEALMADTHTMDQLEGDDASLALRERQRAEAAAKAEAERKRLEMLEADKQRMAQQKGTDPDIALREKQPAEAARTTTIPAPEKGITYKVQITAAHREVGKAYFAARHRYTGNFSIERHEGWIKYVTGSHSTYKAARDQRVAFVQAGHNFPGPFVTAYNDGQRITVQEALMISNQTWVQ